MLLGKLADRENALESKDSNDEQYSYMEEQGLLDVTGEFEFLGTNIIKHSSSPYWTRYSLSQQATTPQGDDEIGTTKRGHMRRLSSSGCAMLDSLLADICNTLVVSSVEQVRYSSHALFNLPLSLCRRSPVTHG